MSAPPKRSHEEATPPAISKRSVEEDGVLQNNPVKLSQPSIGLSNVSSESGLDLRAAKIQRVEQRDVEKRLSPLPFYRLSSSVNGPSSDHPVTNDGKENRDGKSDSREAETSTRDLIADPRVETPVSKAENDTKQENKGEDKLLRPDRESISDFKSESRLEKEGVGWKESKEYHRTKRHSEAQTEHGSQVAEEVRKDVLIGADRDSSEAQEALAESRIDLKGGDERVKDRERRKKEEKHREWGEREKDRSERRAALKPTGNGSKDFAREDRESDRWERERKDTHRDKERRDKEKDSLLHAKEMVEVPPKIPDQEGTSSESKKTNDYDVSKDVDRDVKDKKRERDPDSEMDRSDKRRHQEKESEDGLTEAANEREREPFGYGVQQRKRMLRPRATHSSNREHRFRARARENDGSQGKLDSSAIAYRVGECMQELMKSWREFEASRDGKTDESSQNGPTLEIRIPAEHVTATNRQVRGGQLWGTDIYTDDSDLVAVLMHTGYCRPTSSLPPPSIQELRATVRVLPPQNLGYYSTLRNNVRSRAWGVGIGCSYRVERCTIIKKGGGTLDLEPCLTLISAVEPTLAPVSVERTMTTRSAASNALRLQRFVREVTVQYNLCNEPWVKYSINFVADKGLKKPLYTSARLKKGEVIYLETHFKRYELCYNGEKTVSNGGAGSHATEPEPEKPHHHGCHGQSADKSQERDNFTDVFRWSLCKKPLPQEVMRSIGIPLPVDHLEVLEENLEWDEVQWSQTGVWVAGKEYQLARVHFLFPS